MSTLGAVERAECPTIGIAGLEATGVIQLGRGKVISKGDLASTPGRYPVYSSAKENDGKFGEYGLFMFDEELISWSVDGGGALFHRPKHRFSITNVGGFIRILKPERIFCRYLYFALSHLHSQVKFDWVRKAHPSVIRNVYTDIPLPNLDEQKRIVSVLDEAFAALDRARANAEENLRAARDLFHAELQRQFGSAREDADVLPFESICEPLTPTVKLKRQDYLDEGTYPVVSQEADLISGYWNDPSAVMSIEGPVVVFGDHTCCLKYVDFDFVVGADGTKVLRPFEGVAAKFLYYGLRSQPIQQTGYARHFKLLRETSLPKLSIQEQRRITEHLDEMDTESGKLAKAYEGKLTDIAALRQSLLQAAFSGQLT
ncbi:restriction endonuclease subunit S [Luteimonas aestuarii]|uniref:Restriction endonuclease subunit S n=1 Tax=Luteimonas aestuarii TaxID=453837 RepID=A0A4R5TXV5_9GAMM|nr:restriction endonuclease subunit S [Luteimonas aestuarii]TDK26003.1 restriction endonuclease subunit S [Luteimonas aestuarii]